MLLIFGLKMGVDVLNYNDWAKQARIKRLKTFENIRKYSKNGAKRLKIFENF